LSPDYYFYPADIPVFGSIIALFSDYRNAKVYFVPQSLGLNLTAKRNRNTNITRPVNNTPAQLSLSRDFTTTRGFNFSWKITEGGLLNISTSYNVNIASSLAYLETDEFGMQRRESEIWNDIFSGRFFGKDYQYQQSLDFRTSPKLPSLWDINKYFTLSAGYSASYQWNNDFRNLELGRSAGYSSKASVGLTLRLKALTQPLFAETAEEQNLEKSKSPSPIGERGHQRSLTEVQQQPQNKLPNIDSTNTVTDSLAVADTLELESVKKKSPLKNAFLFLRSIAKTLFFDYESITFNFSSDNNLSKSGIGGKGTGFTNFWGIFYNENNGPTRGFMVGLSNDVGRRAPNGNLNDNFSQRNNFDFKTSRPLWEGAKIDLSWQVGWSINKNTQLTTDSLGNVSLGPLTSTGSISRSFLSLPPVLFLSVFKSGIKKVNELYDPNSPNQRENLSNAFLKGFESLPLLSKLNFFQQFARYIPRPNWRISWDGLENFFLFKSFAKKVTLDHAYNSTYTEGWKINPDGKQEVQTQRIEYGFSPLVGLNFSFGEVWGGTLISSLKYSTKTGYDLGISTTNINENFSKDIGITAGYSKSGFELPFFGLSLKNDIEFSFSYTSTKNSVVIYDFTNFSEEGTPQDGTTRVTLEPRIKYTISSKVTLSIFYRRSSVKPEGAARIPPTTTNEAGLDVHISIQ
ncbi:MAG: cell surface protein SprA, partial [Ignavibacteriaceae bacterium]